MFFFILPEMNVFHCEHVVTLPMVDKAKTLEAVLFLPAGKYRLEYDILSYYRQRERVEGPCYQGFATVELLTG